MKQPSFNRNAKCNSRKQTRVKRKTLMKNSIWTEITAQWIRWTDRATFYRTNETGDKVGCIGRRGRESTRFHPPSRSLLSLPLPFLPLFCCAGLDGVSVARAGTNALPSWANTSRPSFLLAWLHLPLDTFISVQGYLSTDPSLFTWQSPCGCISTKSRPSFARCIFTRFSCFLVPLR